MTSSLNFCLGMCVSVCVCVGGDFCLGVCAGGGESKSLIIYHHAFAIGLP